MTVLDWLQIPIWLFLGITIWNLIWLKLHKISSQNKLLWLFILVHNEESKIGRLLESVT